MKQPLVLLALAILGTGNLIFAADSVSRVPVVFSGGHDTDPRDHGRPVVLVAGALGVAPEVFREAFSHVRPAPAGSQPTPDQVRQNKAALMNALGKYGITNERLDEVSNYYRYRPGSGSLWPTREANAVALISGGKITGFEVVNGGSGYSSPPKVSVPGVTTPNARVELSFGKEFDSNGTVRTIAVLP
jgi:hypothetical protein